MNDLINTLIVEFSHLDSVESILLAGSRAVNINDKDSDYDIYIYGDRPPAIEIREGILNPISKVLEIDNNFWEKEDNVILNDETHVDIIYRTPKWLEEQLERVVINHQANTGYTTCFWYNLLNSKILYDPKDKLRRMQSRFNTEYPIMLTTNIIDKNLPLISDSMTSYIGQIEKAIKREDLISINHRISEFLASYFDILFAINELPHPGEKRLLERSLRLCKNLPENLKDDINTLLKTRDLNSIPDKLRKISRRLRDIL